MAFAEKSIEREIRLLSLLLAVLLFVFFLSFGIFLYLNYSAEKTVQNSTKETTKDQKSSTETTEESPSQMTQAVTPTPTPTVTLLDVEEETQSVSDEYVKGATRLQVGGNLYSLSEDRRQILKNSSPYLTVTEGTVIAFGLPSDESTLYAVIQDEADPKTTYFMQYIKAGGEIIPKRIYRFESAYKMVTFLVPASQVHATTTPKEFYLFLIYEYSRGFKLQVRHLVDYTPEYEIKDISGSFESIDSVSINSDGTLTVTVKTSSGIETVEFFKPE